MKLDPQNLWIYPREWPNAPRGYLFLVPAAEKVAAKLFGNAWKGDGFLLEEYNLPTDMLTAPAERRAYAHSIMPRIYGEAYVPDYENAALGPLGGIASLGGSYGGLGAPQKLFKLGDPPARDEGYWFTAQQWADAQAYLHAVNVENQPRINMAREVSRWLSDEIADGAIRTFLFRVDEQDQREGVASDWQFMNIDRRRRRFRYCTMMPGKPASQSGSHVIFIHAADLAAALERDDARTEASKPAEALTTPLEGTPLAPAPVESDPPAEKPAPVRKVTQKVFNLYRGLLEHYGSLGGTDTHDSPPDRASAATAWANRQNPRLRLPKDAARDVRRIDQLTEQFSKPLQCK